MFVEEPGTSLDYVYREKIEAAESKNVYKVIVEVKDIYQIDDKIILEVKIPRSLNRNIVTYCFTIENFNELKNEKNIFIGQTITLVLENSGLNDRLNYVLENEKVLKIETFR